MAEKTLQDRLNETHGVSQAGVMNESVNKLVKNALGEIWRIVSDRREDLRAIVLELLPDCSEESISEERTRYLLSGLQLKAAVDERHRYVPGLLNPLDRPLIDAEKRGVQHAHLYSKSLVMSRLYFGRIQKRVEMEHPEKGSYIPKTNVDDYFATDSLLGLVEFRERVFDAIEPRPRITKGNKSFAQLILMRHARGGGSRDFDNDVVKQFRNSYTKASRKDELINFALMELDDNGCLKNQASFLELMLDFAVVEEQ